MSPVPAQTVFLLTIAVLAPCGCSLKVHEAADTCACLNWKEVYTQKYGGKCGIEYTGREMAKMAADPPARMIWADQTCAKFFERIDDAFCVNWNVKSKATPGVQWCYVSAECTDLGNGTKANANLAYKTCTPDDQKLSMKSPTELESISQSNELDLAQLVQWAYPVGGKPFSMTRAQIEAVMESGVNTMLDSADTISDFELLSGNKRYKVETNDHAVAVELYASGRLGKFSVMQCCEGCAVTNASACYHGPVYPGLKY